MHYTPIKALERAMHREKDTEREGDRERERKRERERERETDRMEDMDVPTGIFDPGNFRMSGVVLPFSLRSSC